MTQQLVVQKPETGQKKKGRKERVIEIVMSQERAVD
mgnify:CR=1 FL=1